MPRSGSFILGIKSKSQGLKTAPFELSTQQALLKLPYDFHIAGNGLYTMLVTTVKDSKTSKHVSILYQL